MLTGWNNKLRRAGMRIRTKHLFFVLLALLLLSLLPLIYIGMYNYPIQDDFAFSTATRQAWLGTGSFWQVLKAAAGVSREFYTGWQGSYFACFLFALQPAVFGLRGYAAVTPIMLASLLGGTYLFVSAALTRLLHSERWNARFVALALCFVSVQYVPNANQAFYWYNGAVYYTFFHGLLLLLLWGYIRLLTANTRRGRILSLALCCLLAIMVAGGNYVSGLVGLVCIGGMLVVCVIRKNARWKWGLLPTALYIAGFVFSMLAPGNTVRQMDQIAQLGLVRSGLRAFVCVFTYANEWLTLPLFFVLLLLVPFLWRLAGSTGFPYRYPVLITAASTCLLAAAFFPHIYATSEAGPDRLTNIIFFLFVLLAAANLLYWLGWLRRQLEKGAGASVPQSIEQYCKAHALPVLFAAALVAGALTILPGKLNRQPVALTAALSIRSGEAATFGAEMDARYTLAAASPGEDLTVPPITAQPSLLRYGRIYEDPTMWDNEIFAAYFSLASVRELPAEAAGAG